VGWSGVFLLVVLGRTVSFGRRCSWLFEGGYLCCVYMFVFGGYCMAVFSVWGFGLGGVISVWC